MITAEKLRALYGTPSPRAAAKVIDHIDPHARQFIAHASFMILATSDGERMDVSPKGDPAGFVEVEDETHLLIPDRAGNNRIDGLLNILKNPAVGLLFLIPTVNETLRINGQADILDDANICARFAIKGKIPKTVLRVTVQELFLHCGKAPMRGKLWQPEAWPAQRPVGTLYEIIRDQGKVTVETTDQAEIEAGYRKTLY